MDPILQKKAIEVITDAGKEAVSLVITKTTGSNHPEYEKALVLGTAEAIQNLAKNDIKNASNIYESIKMKREQRDFYNFTKVLYKFATRIKIKPKNKIKDDNDFFWNSFEFAKSVSNEEMQDVIAKIIAGEYNNPGSYSMSTLQVLKSISKKELEELQKFTGCMINKGEFYKEFFNFGESQLKIRQIKGYNYGTFIELQNLGLIQSNEVSIKIPLEAGKTVLRSVYGNRMFRLRAKNNNLNYTWPSVYELTNAGKQIIQHLDQDYSPEFEQWLEEFYISKNFDIL